MLANVVLPLVLAFIMFSLGIGLTLRDFRRVFTRPRAVVLGVLAQMLVLPVVAFVLLLFFDLPPAFKVGVMILSFVPGGTTSNMITRLARGDVALSVTLTAVVSIAFVVTLPFLIPAAVGFYQGAELGSSIPVFELFLKAFLITAVPVAIGVLLRHFLPNAMEVITRPVSMAATVLFVVLVLAIYLYQSGPAVGAVARLGTDADPAERDHAGTWMDYREDWRTEWPPGDNNCARGGGSERGTGYGDRCHSMGLLGRWIRARF